MAKVNQSKYIILGLLSFWPMSGYDIKFEIESSTKHFWTISYTQIYSTLKQLEADEWVTKSVKKTEGRPDRYVYALTSAGRDQLQKRLRTPASLSAPRDVASLKLFFGHEQSIPDNIRQLEAYRAQLNEKLAYAQTLEKGITEWYATDGPHREHPNYVLLTVRKELRLIQAQFDWCDDTIQFLNEWKKE